jgi:hypothetical protein
MTPNTETNNWRILAEQVSKEMDVNKLSALIERLCASLDSSVVRDESLWDTLKIGSTSAQL